MLAGATLELRCGVQQQQHAGGDPDEPVAREDVRVGNVVHDVAPGGERELDAEAEEAERCLGDDGGAEAHRAVDDELRDFYLLFFSGKTIK